MPPLSPTIGTVPFTLMVVISGGFSTNEASKICESFITNLSPDKLPNKSS